MESAPPSTGELLADWLAALEARHLADLRFPEVTRALRALSSAYVERRHAIGRGAALDGAGKRAAFALFYAPLHFLAAEGIIRRTHLAPPPTVLDIGCGTGTAGSAWALATSERSRLVGLDRHPWAVEETRWTYRQLGLTGVARLGDLDRVARPKGAFGVMAAYVLNELEETRRKAILQTLLDWASRGTPLLIIEPISRAVTPWWDEAARAAARVGGQAHEWRWPVDLPPLLRRFAVAAGLGHREITARSILVDRRPGA